MTKKISKVKTVETLETSDCRWPIGDPRHAGFHFCGAPQALGRPYCSHHWSLSVEASRSRQQAAPLPLLIKRAA